MAPFPHELPPDASRFLPGGPLPAAEGGRFGGSLPKGGSFRGAVPIAQLTVRHLTKIFGPEPRAALRRLAEGAGRQDLLATGHVVGVHDVTLRVEPGEFLVIMGLSGSGKSTLLRCINRLIEQTAGEVLLDGEAITAASPTRLRHLRRRLGMVFQRFALLPHRTVLENAAFGLEIQGVGEAERLRRAQEALEQVGLAAWRNHRPDELSGGMQQRVGLARALATNPAVLLMDEPFSALDPLIRAELQHELLDLQERLQKTILFITHDLDEALTLGNRVAIMMEGRIVQLGRPEEILQRPANDFVRQFVQAVDRSKVLTASAIMQPPGTVARVDHGPRKALREMERLGSSSIFVVGPGRRLHGLLTAEAAVEAAREGAGSLAGRLQEAVTVDPDTPLRDLLPLAAQTSVPLAVVDGEGRLVGLIPRVAILAALAEAGDTHGVA